MLSQLSCKLQLHGWTTTMYSATCIVHQASSTNVVDAEYQFPGYCQNDGMVAAGLLLLALLINQ